MFSLTETAPDLVLSGFSSPTFRGRGERRLLSLLERPPHEKRLLRKMLDPERSSSAVTGVRAVSRYHKKHPYTLSCRDGHGAQSWDYCACPSPGLACSEANSNCRAGTHLRSRSTSWIIECASKKFHYYYGTASKSNVRTNSGQYLNLDQVARNFRPASPTIFLEEFRGRAPRSDALYPKLQHDSQFSRTTSTSPSTLTASQEGAVGASHQTVGTD
jgi:hypothetical protein